MRSGFCGFVGVPLGRDGSIYPPSNRVLQVNCMAVLPRPPPAPFAYPFPPHPPSASFSSRWPLLLSPSSLVASLRFFPSPAQSAVRAAAVEAACRHGDRRSFVGTLPLPCFSIRALPLGRPPRLAQPSSFLLHSWHRWLTGRPRWLCR